MISAVESQTHILDNPTRIVGFEIRWGKKLCKIEKNAILSKGVRVKNPPLHSSYSITAQSDKSGMK